MPTTRALLTALAIVIFYAIGVAVAEGGHVFRSEVGDESVALIDETIAEVMLPGDSVPQRGRYATKVEGETHKLEVRLRDGERLSYRLAAGGLRSERSGKLLRLAPP